MGREWSFRLRGGFYSMALYTRQGGSPRCLEEAVDTAEDQYGDDWTEVYNGVEGTIRD